jgi:hypothetical protein
MRRLSLTATLALLCALGLSVMAGSAFADNYYDGDTPGSQWGGHEINGTMTWVGFEMPFIFQVEASDPRVSGLMYVSVKRGWDDADGLCHTSGTYDLYNADGGWHCSYWECVHSRSYDSDKPWQGLVLTCEARGSGDYKGLVFAMSHHQAAGSDFILKGWILPAK